ncbi:hypothetical protein H4CHR_05572 [Variovorax sp. PBS-H4]|uniref:hypothetical protein n=1 Tax=Variovorax sp. PBS-H4 TaxID=434008 RepID=UPI0013193532|nr:hypothetical protein [Variovorax sp. PBS-H4]VTU40839.1 hypothetical protein H4CHR_05572 [Variovorax sp. PBS-H4]
MPLVDSCSHPKAEQPAGEAQKPQISGPPALERIPMSLGAARPWEPHFKCLESAIAIGVVPNVVEFNYVIFLCGSNNRFDKARDVVALMDRLGVKPN